MVIDRFILSRSTFKTAEKICNSYPKSTAGLVIVSVFVFFLAEARYFFMIIAKLFFIMSRYWVISRSRTMKYTTDEIAESLSGNAMQ